MLLWDKKIIVKSQRVWKSKNLLLKAKEASNLRASWKIGPSLTKVRKAFLSTQKWKFNLLTAVKERKFSLVSIHSFKSNRRRKCRKRRVEQENDKDLMVTTHYNEWYNKSIRINILGSITHAELGKGFRTL